MGSQLKEISQISIYLKEKSDKVNEVALFQPFIRRNGLQDLHKPVLLKKWNFTSRLSVMERMTHNVQKFLFRHFPAWTPKERTTSEAKFKTVLAFLLAQEGIRDFFLSDMKRREDFIFALEEASHACGYHDFSAPPVSKSDTPLQLSRLLTLLEGTSLVDDHDELNLQMAALTSRDRNEILFQILNKIERPPMTSVLEVISSEELSPIEMTTRYAKYKILYWDPISEKITYFFSENHATSSIRTQDNVLPDAIGAMNQRAVLDEHEKKWIGTYCGELSTPYHLLEQILWILNEKEGEIYILEDCSEENIIEQKILFTSLYGWNEMDLITQQQAAIRHWDRKILKSNNKYYRLKLLYFNIPFNSLNKYPTPGEVKAVLQDINDEALIILIAELLQVHSFKCEKMRAIGEKMESLKNLPRKEFVPYEKGILEEIDVFREVKKQIAEQLEGEDNPLFLVVKALLTNYLPDGKQLKGIDKLVYLDAVVNSLGYYHNKNCHNAAERAATAEAADKARYAYHKIRRNHFLPGYASAEENVLFKILYSLYFLWEEPEVQFLLNTGFREEALRGRSEIYRNPEITRYLYN